MKKDKATVDNSRVSGSLAFGSFDSNPRYARTSHIRHAVRRNWQEKEQR